jgi:hypothetical protein
MDGPPAIPNDKQVEVLHLFRCFTHTQERVVCGKVVWGAGTGRSGRERTTERQGPHTKIDFNAILV